MKKRILYYISFVFVFILCLFLIVDIKASAWSGYDSDFEPYRHSEQRGQIVDMYPKGAAPVAKVYVYDGSAYGLEFEFICMADEDGGDFEDNLGNYEIGLDVIWNVDNQRWEFDDYMLDYYPVFDGETAFVTMIDSPISIDDILSRIKAIDNEDGDISHLIQVVDGDYEPGNITELGEYFLKLSVEDSSGNVAELTVYVLVKDIYEPVITGEDFYEQSYTKKKNIQEIIDELSVSDNYDPDDLLTIQVENDDYSENYSQLGEYEITFRCKDSSDNIGYFTVVISVVDDVAPVFSGPTNIVKGQRQVLTLDDILGQIAVNDYWDEDIEFVVVEDTYTGNGVKVGNYTIKLSATDFSGNTGYHEITIVVMDDIPPVFYVDKYFIHVDDIVKLTKQDIIELLHNTGQLYMPETTYINFKLNEYEGNEDIPGVYGVVIEHKSTDGTSGQISLAIIVHETDEEEPIVVEPKKNWFKETWEEIWNWLKKPIKEDSKFYNGYYVLIGIGVIVLALVVLFVPKNKYRYRYGSRRRRW